MWALSVIADSNLPNASKAAASEKARAWLGDQTVGKSTEWWATRALLEKRIGKSEKADLYRQELLKRQRADGGWGWLCDDESDALGTGIALFSLADSKDHSASAAVVNARRFLAQSQTKDGSWPTHGTKDNKKNQIEPTATYWATCWAVIGLCATPED
jgi:squalene-hopene/tetraprenyl-beta-curcumene cyclase